MKEKNDIEDTAALSPKFTFNPKEGIDNPALVINEDIELSVLIKPRICVLTKKDNEVFGFYLRAEKRKQGHIIRQVEPGSYAQLAGLYDADRVLEINGEFVDNMEHSKVVSKIKRSGNQVTFLVVDGAAYEDAKMQNLDFAEIVQAEHGTPYGKPRLCYVEKTPSGFDFQLCSHDGVKGQFTLSIQPGGAAEKGGLQMDDRLIEVNGVNIEGCTHLQVARKIKESGDSVTFLVADQKTDAYYRDKGIKIIPAMACLKHLPFRTRKLYLVKGSCGYGFLLKTEKTASGTLGQYLSEVDAGSPAEKCGMQEGDRLLSVNGENIEGLDHGAVVKKVRQGGNQATFVVISSEGDKYFTSLGLSPLICDDEEQVNPKQTTEGQSKEHPPLQPASPSPSQVAGERKSVPKPRLCHLVKGSKGYGFQLYSITDEPGAYIQQVLPDEVGYNAGIRTGDIVIEVNGKNIEKVHYEDVLLRIKENEDKVTLLVMNKDEYWHCKDNNIPISKEPDSEDNELKTTRNPDKGIFSSFNTKNRSRRNSSGHPVNKLRISGRLKKNT
ncbi:Na(+)/H(+) exchange regulatory cofactor NHE-RF3-like isoform X1 [Mobula hypostoma]|uniref:Na(+)/H(+) exchange regulatory cofactor NHE-RF3-like isoform X1 n=1 Tax=Mobula hypostoma TaxID=723540 RepID=UPI002FC3B405